MSPSATSLIYLQGRGSTASLGSPFQCLTTLSTKREFISLIFISSFSYHQFKNRISKIGSFQNRTWKIPDSRFLLYPWSGGKEKIGWASHHPTCSFQLHLQKFGHFRSLFQTSLSLTLTSQWQKTADCQNRAPMLVFSTTLEKWRSASARGKGAKEEAALLNGKSLQEL